MTSTGAKRTSSDVRLEWDVSADVQAFVSGSATNNGWRISDQTENAATSPPEGKFASAEHGTTALSAALRFAYYP